MRKLILFFLLLPLLANAQVNNARMLSGVNSQTGTTYPFVAADATRLTTFANASGVSATLANPASFGFGPGTLFSVQNLGTGTVTIACTSCKFFSNGTAGSSTFTLSAGQGADIYSQGLNYYVQSGATLTGTLPQLGDIPRYNVNLDNSWDPVSYAQSMVGIYAVNQTAALEQIGALGVNGVTFLGASSDQAPTATSQSGKIAVASATASTNTVIGYFAGNNGNQSLLGMLAFYRWSTKFAAGGTTNVRYWMGWSCYNIGGTGGNTATITGTTAYATDTPNKTTIGFRYSAGTDTHWQAVTVVAGSSSGSQTTVDTGIAPDTNPHLFEMTTNTTGTAVNYFIDGALVATITTNLPNPANLNNSVGDPFFTGDNKNTNNAISATFYYTQIALK